jgi:hypothetical protein
VELVRLDPPLWFSESELPLVTGGPAPIPAGPPSADALRLHVRAGSGRVAVAAYGSVAPEAGPVNAEVWIADQLVERIRVSDGFVIHTVVETGATPPHQYVPIMIRSAGPTRFTDLTVGSASDPATQYGMGFYPPEQDEAGQPFRWMSRTARAAVHVPAGHNRLKVRAEIPLDYFTRPVLLTIRWNGEEIATVQPSTYVFSVERTLAAADQNCWGDLTLEASNTFVPTAIEGGGDVRELSFRINGIEVE